jgi:hypothetical protein
MAFIYDLVDAWNAGGTSFNAIRMNVTDTASAAASRLISLQINGSERFSVRKDGQGFFAGNLGVGATVPPFRLVSANSTTDGGWLYSAGAVSILGLGGYSAAGDGAFHIRYDRATGAVTFNGGSRDTPVERMRIDATGNVGIGTSSPGARLDVNGTIWARASAGAIGLDVIGRSADNAGQIRFLNNAASTTLATLASYGNDVALLNNTASFSLILGTNATERMRIDSSGNVLVGTSVTEGPSRMSVVSTASTTACISYRNTAGAGSTYAYFLNGGNTAQIGSITNSGNTGTAYNTSSDARLKHDIVEAPEASDLIDAIKVRSFKWNVDNSEQRYGFVAQELVEVAPEAVHQPEDKDQMMAVDYSKLVPMLVKEIQSLRARVAQLEGN